MISIRKTVGESVRSIWFCGKVSFEPEVEKGRVTDGESDDEKDEVTCEMK